MLGFNVGPMVDRIQRAGTVVSVDSSGNTNISAGSLKFGAAASKIVPGATSLSFRNNADGADNLLISNAGVVTVRAGLVVTAGGATITAGNVAITAGNLTFGAASAKIIPGATSLLFRNNADGATNLAIADGGVATHRSYLFLNGQTSGPIETNTLSINDNAVARISPTTDSWHGIVFITDLGTGKSAIYVTTGGVHTTAEVSDPGTLYTPTAANSGTINVIWSSGNSRYEIENKTGGAINLLLWLMRSGS